MDRRSAEYSSLRAFLVVTALAAVVLLLLPAELRGPASVPYSVYATVVALLRCLRLPSGLRSVTVVMVSAAILSLVGALVRQVQGAVIGGTVGFPSVADLFPFVSYLLFIGAILTVVRRRNPHVGLDPILDAMVAGVSAGLLQWSLVVIPFLRNNADDLSGRAAVVVFSTLSLLLVVAAVLALVAGSKPSASNRLLAAGLVMTFASDVAATLATDGRAPAWVVAATSMPIFVLGGAGLLHPSVIGLFERSTDTAASRRLSRRRTVVLTFALVTPPTLLLWQVLQGNRGVDLLLPAFGACALAPLALVRLARLVHQNEQLANMEVTLRSVGERLVGAETEADVTGIISVGLEQVLGEVLVDGRLLGDLERSDVVSRAGALAPGVQAIIDRDVDRDGWRPLATGELVRVEPERDGVWLVGAVVVQRRLRGALVVVATRDLNDVEANAVGSLCREASIALRAVERTESHVRRRSEERFASLVTSSSDIVAILDDRGSLTYVSPAAERLLGWDPAGGAAADVVHPGDVDALRSLVTDARFGREQTIEVRLRTASEDHEWFEVTAVDLHGDPNIGGVVVNARAIGDRKIAQEQLELSEARFKSLVQHSSDLVLVVDSHDRIRYASPSAARALGEPPEGILGRPVGGVFNGSEVNWETALRAAPRNSTEAPASLEFGFRNAGGSWVQMEAMITDLRAEPAVRGFVINARNVTERRRMMQRLRYQATHDSLTGLPNRVLAAEELAGMLSRNAGGSTVAVVSLDLDDFKDINDSLGHAVGDKLLLAIAERMKEPLAFGDLAARSGGDEFVVVLERAHGEDQVLALADDLLVAFRRPFIIEGRELRITVSIGVVCDHDRQRGGEALLRDAETAMYRAKQDGRHRIVMFEPHMRTASFDRLELRADLQQALGTEQFVVYYQPVLDLFSGRVIGAEALVRWDHPRRGLLSPAIFVPTAEELGVIDRLGSHVLERACRDSAAWRAELPELAGDLSIAVNLSAQELHSEALIGTVTGALERTGMSAHHLVLEVTESNLLHDTDVIRERMHHLRSLGARLAIDDFGTGYSSLGYIQRFEFDILKIDRTFVEGLEHPTNNRIVTAVLELASQLGVRVVAEGIEEEDQERLLLGLGCRLGQGFLYSRPIPEADFRAYLMSTQRSDVG